MRGESTALPNSMKAAKRNGKEKRGRGSFLDRAIDSAEKSVELLLHLLLLATARQRELCHQKVPCLFEKSSLTKAQLFFAAKPAQIPKDLGDLNGRAAVEHLRIFAIAPIPRLRRHGDLITFQGLNHGLRVLTRDDRPKQARSSCGRDHHLHAGLDDMNHIEALGLPLMRFSSIEVISPTPWARCTVLSPILKLIQNILHRAHPAEPGTHPPLAERSPLGTPSWRGAAKM